MKNVIVIIYSNDIPAAAEIAKNLDDYETYVFDPTLVDRVTTSKLSNVKLVAWDDCIDISELIDWSHATAFEMEKELDRSVQDIIPGVSICSWQHLSLHYFLNSYRWYSGLWENTLTDLRDSKFHVFMYDNPAQSVFPSFIPSLLLMQKLRADSIEFSAYTYGKKEDDTGLIPDLCHENHLTDNHNTIITHLPTCLYDHTYFNDELKASGRSVTNIQSKYWDVPITAENDIGIINIKDVDDTILEKHRKQIEAFADCILEALHVALSSYTISNVYRTRQAEHMASIYKSQLVTYYLLEEHFKVNKPDKMLLSEHDAGFHGPLFSFAANHCIPVLLVPHSKCYGMIEFNYRNITALTHPIQGECVLDGTGRKVLNFNLTYPENFAASTVYPGKIKKIGVLLNGISLNGVYSTRYKPYVEGIKKIYQWCNSHNIQLSVRCRPGISMLTILANETGMDIHDLSNALNVSLPDFAKSIDLCLMYDGPTSAALDFLKNSIPILNPIPEDISWHEANTVSTKVVPRNSIDVTLKTLETFVSDELNFYLFKTAQFRDYLNMFNGAYPLRHFL